MILHLFPLIFWAILLTLAITPITIIFAVRFQLIDRPNSLPHKIHQHIIPKAGGLAICMAILAINVLSENMQSATIRGILLAAMVIFLFGLWDDAHSLSPRWKLIGQTIGVAILLSQGIYIRMLGNMIVLNLALTIIWVVGITNAFNFIDSMDGLAIGISAIASAFFMLVTIDAGQPSLSLLSAILLGSCLGMLYFNAMPAQTFLGDS